MKTIKISGGFTGKVATGSYENSSPSFFIEETVENCTWTDGEILERSQFLTNKCKEMFDGIAKALTIERIKNDFKFLRILDCPKCGLKHPSVTTVRDFDKKGFYCTEAELELARAYGIIQDLRCKHFISTGKWVEAKEITSCAPHLVTLKGSGVDANWYNFPAFLKKYPLKDMKNGERFFNCEVGITGELDMIGTPDGWDFAEAVPSVVDYKRTIDKLSLFTQLSCYAKHHGLKQMIGIPVGGDSQQGFSKPVVSTQVDEYYEIFMDQRRKFRSTYGL